MADRFLIIFILIGNYKELIKYFPYCTLHCKIATAYIRQEVPDQHLLVQSQQ